MNPKENVDMNENEQKTIEINIEIPDSLKRRMKSEAAMAGVSLKEFAAKAFADFLSLPEEERSARLAQWKSTTLTQEGSHLPKTSEGNPKPLPFYSPSQAPLLPPNLVTKTLHGIKLVSVKSKPVKGILHGVSLGETSETVPSLSAVREASERSL